MNRQPDFFEYARWDESWLAGRCPHCGTYLKKGPAIRYVIANYQYVECCSVACVEGYARLRGKVAGPEWWTTADHIHYFRMKDLEDVPLSAQTKGKPPP